MRTEGERVVLLLLVGERALPTADAWAAALHAHLPRAHDPRTDTSTPADSSLSPWSKLVFAAVDSIVPHLFDYKTFYENLSWLLKFCEQECRDELFNMVCRWLVLGPTTASRPFRRWLYAYVAHFTILVSQVDTRQWKQAVLVAALQETDEQLKSELLRLIDRQLSPLTGVVDKKKPLAPTHNELHRLQVFFWTHAKQLSASTALCAAKFLALTRGGVAPSENILALLRWGRVLQPLFFGNFVDELLRFKALRRPSDLELRVPSALETFLQETKLPQSVVLAGLESSRQQLLSATLRDVYHVYQRDSAAQWTNEYAWAAIDVDVAERTIGCAANDLAVIPSEAFPPVFAVFTMSAITLLRSHVDKKQAQDSSRLIATSLFGLLTLRADSPSLLLVLAAIIDLRIASLPLWREDPDAFIQTIDELSEAVILETDETKRWVLQMSLRQLVLECDAAVLVDHMTALEDRLPHESFMLVRKRMTPP